MASEIDICSDALARLGAEPIQSFDDASSSAQLLVTVWPLLRDYLLSLHPWHFATTTRQLARLATPPLHYRHAYALPSDLLAGPRAVYDRQPDGRAAPISRYTVEGGAVLSDAEALWVVYQHGDVPTRLWPPVFVELASVALAARIAMTVTDNAALATSLDAQAWGSPGESRSGGLFRAARQWDSQRAPAMPLPFEQGPLLAAHDGGW